MPIITVNLLSGRDRAKKEALLRALTDAAVGALDVPASTVRILLNEIPPEHWCVGGESKAAEVTRKSGEK